MSIRMGDKILAANYKPNNATQDVAGLVRLATEEEITEGTSTESVVTPYQLKETVNNKANIDLDNLSEAGETRFNGKASIDLDNLSEAGETHFDNKYLGTYNITNCLLEVPQRIKYGLADGTLTIKAGSVVIVPYGTEDLTAQYPVGATFLYDSLKVYDTQFIDGKFFVWVEILSDIQRNSFSTNGNALIFINFNNGGTGGTALGQAAIGAVSSGTSDPNTGYYYRTNENKVYHLGNWYGYSFPIMVGLANGTTLTSIDSVFNGIGYIGSTIWVDKGVKGLIPNGRNTDGSLNNQEWITSSVITRTFLSNQNVNDAVIALNPNEPIRGYKIGILGRVDFEYKEAENLNWELGKEMKWPYTPIVRATTTNGAISNFQPKLPFRAVDYSEYVNDLYGLAKADDLYGIWHGTGVVLTQNTACSKSTKTSFNLSNYLPKDGNNYEVLIDSTLGISKGQVGKVIKEVISTSIQTGFFLVEVSSDYNNYPSSSTGNTHCAVGPDRKLNISFEYSTGTGTYSLYARGYRKIR